MSRWSSAPRVSQMISPLSSDRNLNVVESFQEQRTQIPVEVVSLNYGVKGGSGLKVVAVAWDGLVYKWFPIVRASDRNSLGLGCGLRFLYLRLSYLAG